MNRKRFIMGATAGEASLRAQSAVAGTHGCPGLACLEARPGGRSTATRPWRRRQDRGTHFWKSGAFLALLILFLPTTTSALAQPQDRLESDRRCLQCHGRAHIAELSPADRRSMVGTWLDTSGPQDQKPVIEPLSGDEPPTRPGLFVTRDHLAASPHADNKCIDCHEDAAKLPHAARLQKATCATACHEQAAASYSTSAHHEALLREDPLAPTCASCHGGHDILRISDRKAPQHKLNSVHLCGDCHAKHTATPDDSNPAARVSNYLDSAHARAVTKSGLPTAATCADCHGAHGVRPSKDQESAVHRKHIPETCGKCHMGVVEVYDESVHGKKHKEENGNGKAAVCTDCHTAHQITTANTPDFLRDVINECGRCHDSPDANGDRVGTYYKTYAESYHGQVTHLGGARAARCSDCHGSHDILPLSDPRSRVADANIVETCGKCHPGSNAKFVRFDPHANHRDARNYPVLHAVWLYFMVMMTSVFTFFGIHTILWFVRSLIERKRAPGAPVLPALRQGRAGAPAAPGLGEDAKTGATTHADRHIRRFTALDRINHLLVAVTFFGLTATGIPLVFAQEDWAKILAALLGGIEAAGLWHRFFAVLLIGNFILHFVGLGRAFIRRTCSWKDWLFGTNSLLPRWKDVADCLGMFRWFLGRGKRPRLGRWTYWEKFDYWAEVGGSMIIGGSGLLLWFPELAARIVPGWLFNVAMIVHGYEALLAIGFIFTIHFFNTHVRPDAFPVDEVIFTGSLPEHELKEHRPDEYDRLVQSGRLESLRVPAPNPARRPFIVAVAAIAVGIGLVLLACIIAGGFF